MNRSDVPLRLRLAARGLDGVTLLVLPSIALLFALFVYPVSYGRWLSFNPKTGSWLGNYTTFFSDPFLYDTVITTLRLALPVTVFNVVVALPVAFRVRLMQRQRVLTTILVLPVTLGTVLIAEGLLNYLGPQGWLSRSLMLLGLVHSPVKLLHNYWGVFISLVLTGFPFTFLLILSYVTGIDPALERAAEKVLGDDTESLRLAQQELESLTQQLEREMAQANAVGNTQQGGQQSASTQNGQRANGQGQQPGESQQPGQGQQPQSAQAEQQNGASQGDGRRQP